MFRFNRSHLTLQFIALCVSTLAFGSTPEEADYELVVGSRWNNTLVRFNLETGSLLGTIDGPLSSPRGLTLGPDGDLFVGGCENDGVLRYNLKTNEFEGTFVGAGSGGLDCPHGLVFGPDGDLYVTSWWNHNVFKYDGETGEPLGVFASGSGLNNPHGIDFGPDGNLYVASRGNHLILRYDGMTGEFIDVFIPNGTINTPGTLIFGPDENLYVDSAGANRVEKFDGFTGEHLDTIGAGKLDNPTGLAFGPDGLLYIANHDNNRILVFDPDSGDFVQTFYNRGAPLDGPVYMVVHENYPGPSEPTVSILPEAPNTTHDLTCIAEGSLDPEGLPISYSFQWLIDGMKVQYDGFNPVTSPSLSHVYTSRNQIAECVVTPHTSLGSGTPNSATVAIINSPPTQPEVSILPENPTPDDGLAVWIEEESTDFDGDKIVYLFEWFSSFDGSTWNRRPELSGTLAPYAHGSPEISALYTRAAQYWLVTVTPIESQTVSKGNEDGRSLGGGAVLGESHSFKIRILPDLDEDDIVGVTDLHKLKGLLGKSKSELNRTDQQLFFDDKDPGDALVDVRYLFGLASSWQEKGSGKK